MRKRRSLDPTFFDALEQRLVLSSRSMMGALAPAVVASVHNSHHQSPIEAARARFRRPRLPRRFVPVGPVPPTLAATAGTFPIMRMSALTGTSSVTFTNFAGGSTLVSNPMSTPGLISPGTGGGGAGGGGGGGGGGSGPSY